MFARAAWAAITAAWTAMEFEAVKRRGGKDPKWPPYTHFLRELRGQRDEPQFWALVGVWLWLGWHVFLQRVPDGS